MPKLSFPLVLSLGMELTFSRLLVGEPYKGWNIYSYLPAGNDLNSSGAKYVIVI